MPIPKHLEKLMESLKRLPGVGSRTAERYAFALLGWPEEEIKRLGSLVEEIPEKVLFCEECGCLKECFCQDQTRDPSRLCVAATAREALAIEATGQFTGHYHCLGGVLSPLEGVSPEKLTIQKLLTRLERVQEVILAFDSTLEGEATALYLKEQLERFDLLLTRPATGLPMGTSVEYVDVQTLGQALQRRAHL